MKRLAFFCAAEERHLEAELFEKCPVLYFTESADENGAYVMDDYIRFAEAVEHHLNVIEEYEEMLAEAHDDLEICQIEVDLAMVRTRLESLLEDYTGYLH